MLTPSSLASMNILRCNDLGTRSLICPEKLSLQSGSGIISPCSNAELSHARFASSRFSMASIAEKPAVMQPSNSGQKATKLLFLRVFDDFCPIGEVHIVFDILHCIHPLQAF